MEPRISAIIPLYNGAPYIEAALRSVLAQSLPPVEIIVVDDGSTDEGPGIVERLAGEFPITLLHKENGGQSSARNFGVAHSSGELIALLDQDDIWYPDHLAVLAEPFATPQVPTVGWVYSNLDQIDAEGRLVTRSFVTTLGIKHPKQAVVDCIHDDMFVLPSASLIAREAFEAVGGFDERLSGYEDDDLFLRLFRAGYANEFIDRPLSQWRIYAASTSYSPRMGRSRLVFMRKLLEDFPDDIARSLFYRRDVLIPRFYPRLLAECRKAITQNNDTLLAQTHEAITLLLGSDISADRLERDPGSQLISAVIPLHDGARTIEQALRSVLCQTLPAVEIIVVDDGSTDEGPAIVERLAAEFPITLLRKPQGGPSSARNFGVAQARGDYIALLDQGDVWYPSHLERLVAPFAGRHVRRLGWSYSDLDQIDEDGSTLVQLWLGSRDAPHPKRTMADCLRDDMCVLPSASLIAREAFLAVGGFDEALSGYEDDDLFLRLFHAGYDNAFIPEALSRWRICPASPARSLRAAKNRAAYARKLLELFPDEPGSGHTFARDLIVPRFYRQFAQEYRQAIAAHDLVLLAFARGEMEHLNARAGDGGAAIRPLPGAQAMFISAVIPLYNGAPYIEEALRSVFRQTLPPVEVIVVDDGSTDAGPAIVERLTAEFPITLLHKENGGQSSARNFGVARARGDYIALLDQDDVWYPDHLERLAAPFAEPRVRRLGWTYSDLDQIDADGRTVTQLFLKSLGTPHPKHDLFDCLRDDMFVLPSASLVAREAFLAVGGFDEKLSGYEDDDLFLRLFRAGYDNVFLPEALSRWRIYPASSSYSVRMSKSRAIYARKLLDLFPDEPDRRRYITRDLIVPRFYRQFAEECRRAVDRQDDALLALARAEMAYLRACLPGGGGQTQPSVGLRAILISAVIPLYNGAPYIEEALRSVFRQTLPPVEVIVVDDGSTDAGPAIVERLTAEFPITLLHKENGGQSSARNFGVARARGDYIALLDQDDVWYPDHLERLAAPFAEPRVRRLGWTYSDLDQIDADGRTVTQLFLKSLGTPHPKHDLFDCLRDDMFVLPSASLVAREAFLAVGGFDEKLSGYEDDDLFLRLFRAGYDNVFLPEALSRWRIYPASSSYSVRMARSRAVYARKLIAAFPDEPERNRYYRRDLIVPRFYRQFAEECRKAVKRQDDALLAFARGEMAYLRSCLSDAIGRARPGLEARTMLISAVIPLYNGARTIEEALQSIFRQTLPPIEVIVVDDGSTDAGPAIVERLTAEFPITLLHKENGGQSSARNFGVARARGDYIALLDQDDVWYPFHLERLAEPFTQARSRPLGWTYSDLDQIDEAGSMVTQEFLYSLGTPHPKRDMFDCIRADMFVLPSASLIAREAFLAVGGFDEALSGYEDDDLFLRLFRADYDNAFIPEALSQWRIYPTSSSYSVRMARSRAVYARKLLATYPDEPEQRRYYRRDLIVPRFFPQMVAEYMKSLRSGDMARVRGAVRDFAALAPYPRWLLSLAVTLLASPLVANPVGARVVTALAPLARPVVRRALRPPRRR